MSTLTTILAQDIRDADVYVAYNVGDGECPTKPSYASYRALASENARRDLQRDLERESYAAYDLHARERGLNSKLSPFDDRVRTVCRLRGLTVTELEFENDHALDSGVWWKFIRGGLWRQYDYVLCVQEGTILTQANVLSAALRFANEGHADFVAGAHMKAALPQSSLFDYNGRHPGALPIDHFHDRMIRETFDTFRRDPEFDRAFALWPDDIEPQRQHHVPDIWGQGPWQRLRRAVDADAGLPDQFIYRAVATWLRDHRPLVRRSNARLSALRVMVGPHGRIRRASDEERIYVDTVLRRLDDVVSPIDVDGVKFHREDGVECYGCGCNHLFSRRLLERLTERMERYGLYDALDLPFAGTALEVIWGFIPRWLGADKWFFNGLHRVAKNFATYRREDEPMDVADYLNRYYAGDLAVGWQGDYLKVWRATAAHAARLRHHLDASYF